MTPHQAAAALALLFLAAGTPCLKAEAPPAAPQAPTVGTVREATVSAVYVTGEGAELRGGTAPVVVSVSANPTGAPSVGVLEEFFGGVGSQCQASAWIAAMASSQAFNGMINDHRFTLQVGSHVDGPSMGMLVAAAMLALLKGDALLPGVTLTGAVNPDGTAGPVGAIPVKMDGAKAANLKTFGYPVGCRMDWDPRTNKRVDVEDYGTALGLKVVEVRNLFDAYELLTGKKWERAKPLPERRLKLTGALSDRIEEACTALSAELDERQPGLLEKARQIEASRGKNVPQTPLASGMAADLSRDLQATSAFRRRGSEAMSGGAIAQAYLNLRVADQLSGIAEAEANLLLPLTQKGPRAAAKEWEAYYTQTRRGAEEKLRALKAALKARTGEETLGERMDILHCYLQYGEALVDYLWADRQRAEIEKLFAAAGEARENAHAESPDRLLTLLKQSIVGWSRSGRRADSALKWARFPSQPGPPVMVPPQFYERLGKAYASASGAAVGYFDALIIRRDAAKRGIPPEQAAAEFEQKEGDYGFIKAATRHAELEPGSPPGLADPSDPLERFTTALYAYTGASALLMKYYTFHAGAPQPAGGVAGAEATQFTRRKALSATLDGARERVLEDAARLEAEAGLIPDSIKLNFDLASTLRDGNSDAERMLALKAYWRCNLLCHLTRLLVRQP